MNKQLISMTMLLTIAAGFQAQANVDVDLDDVTMDIATTEIKRGKKINFQVREIIQEFRLENGDITQEDIDAHKAERAANREEMKALKESGDTDALAAKREELKAQHLERRTAMKEYIDSNEDLKAAVEAQKEEAKASRQEQKEERRERKKSNREVTEVTDE